MPFFCTPSAAASTAKAGAKSQALRQQAAGLTAYTGVSLLLLLVDKQVDAKDVLPHAALGTVHTVRCDAERHTLAELVGKVREAHRQNGAPFLSTAVAQHGPHPDTNQWAWTTDCSIDLNSIHGAIDQLTPVTEVLAAALSKTAIGKVHIDILACGLATACESLVPALEKMYGVDFRASTDDTGHQRRRLEDGDGQRLRRRPRLPSTPRNSPATRRR